MTKYSFIFENGCAIMTVKKGGNNLIDLFSYRKKMNQESTAAANQHTEEQNELKLLLSQISRGNEDAMKAFYQKTVRLVYGMANRIIPNSEEAEEVALEVFMYVWNNASKYDAELSKPLSWLLMITRSRAIDKIRKGTRTVQVDDSIDESMVTGSDNPEDTYIASEMRRITKYAMSQLSEKQREVIELSYYQQCSHSEISDKVGIPLGSVKSTIRVAMVKMKNIIKEEQGNLHESRVY